MLFPDEFYAYLNTHTLVEIKGGRERKTFLPIWMVVVNKRVFAKSWDKSERSWFTAIQDTGVGQIKYGDRIVNITGTKLKDQPETIQMINKRYLEKYNQKENLPYSTGITQAEYDDYIMEFFFEVESIITTH